MVKINIENGVASSTIADELNAESISMLLDDAEYEPEQFPIVVFLLIIPTI